MKVVTVMGIQMLDIVAQNPTLVQIALPLRRKYNNTHSL